MQVRDTGAHRAPSQPACGDRRGRALKSQAAAELQGLRLGHAWAFPAFDFPNSPDPAKTPGRCCISASFGCLGSGRDGLRDQRCFGPLARAPADQASECFGFMGG